MDGYYLPLTDDQASELRANEAFIRRAALVDAPFMLKGSYVTRQYFHDKRARIPGDLDWVYLEPLADVPAARSVFDAWANAVTNEHVADGVVFENFLKNAFWRSIDYAMAEDFPTVNTDLICYVDGEEVALSIDISFNLGGGQRPVTLRYEPLTGAPFEVPRTVPISLQVSWKIHQTLVRPRFKDLFDLMHLVRHKDFSPRARAQCLQALMDECAADGLKPEKLLCFFNHQLEYLYPPHSFEENWKHWRFRNHSSFSHHHDVVEYEQAHRITDADRLPGLLSQFVEQWSAALTEAGLGASALQELPPPTRARHGGEPSQSDVMTEDTEAEVVDTAPTSSLLERFRAWLGIKKEGNNS
ncbi:nucleotidyl transferase AbiEii/AbiGii toxin family protein [Flaviaesturariibacter amylovorans]|uniref:Nucleotidyl transferase AbiEii/AbiGii toxin family protein n=1 Tax=Flaviaesturariibacter amylovorans TaxID=1084520 RepID=A0ABP8GHV5_9BACT